MPCIFPGAQALPEPIFNSHGVDFRDADQGAEGLISRLRSGNPREVKYDYALLPPNSFIPFNPNPYFLGRHGDLLALYLKLVGNLNKIGINQVGMVGMGGVGKTQLAVEFAYRFSFAFDAVYWVNAAHPEEWSHQFTAFAKDCLQLKIDGPQAPGNEARFLYQLRSYCRSHPQTLIVMDNVTEPNLLHSEEVFGLRDGLTPLTLGCNLLFTTRKRFQLPGVSHHSVETLSPGAALDLLTHSRQLSSPAEVDAAKSICSAAGYLPLALVLSAGYLEKYRTVSFVDYHREMERNRLGAIDVGNITPAELATRHEAAVGFTLDTQLRGLKDDTAERLLNLAALFPEASVVPKALLCLLSGFDPRPSRLERPAERAFLSLHELCLVEELNNGVAVRVHPLIRDFVAGRLSSEEQTAARVEAFANLEKAYRDPDRLQRAYLERGINQLIEELDLALKLGPADTVAEQEMARLRTVLDRERHNLSLSRADLPVEPSIALQIHRRAQAMGLTEIAGRYYEAGAVGAPARLKAIASGTDEPSLIRRFADPSASTESGGHHAVSFLAGGDKALSISPAGQTYLWDVGSGQLIRPLRKSAYGSPLSLSADGKTAFSVGDGTLNVWEAETGKVLRSFSWLTKGEARLQNSYFFLSFLGHRFLFHFFGASLAEKFFEGPIALDISSDGAYGASCSRRAELILWDLENGRRLHSFKARPFGNQESWDWAVGLDADSRRALLYSTGEYETKGYFILYDLNDSAVLNRFEYETYRSPRMKIIKLIAGGTQALACWGAELTLYDLEAGKVLRKFSAAPRDAVAPDDLNALAVARDEEAVLTGYAHGALGLWEVRTGEPVKVYRNCHAGGISAVGLSPDGRQALSAGHDGTLALWNLEHGPAPQDEAAREATQIPQHSLKVSCLNLTSDGYLVSASVGQVIIWDVETLRPVRVLKTEQFFLSTDAAELEAISISADDRLILSVTDKRFFGTREMDILSLEDGSRIDSLRGSHSVPDAQGGRVSGLSLEVRVSLSADGARLRVKLGKKDVSFWDFKSGQLPEEIQIDNAGDDSGRVSVPIVMVCSNDRPGSPLDDFIGYSLGASKRGVLLLWHEYFSPDSLERRGGVQAVYNLARDSEVTEVFLGRERALALIDYADGLRRLLNLQTGDVITTFAERPAPTSSGQFSVTSSGRVLILRDADDGRALSGLILDNPISCVALLGNRAVAGDDAGLVHFIDVDA